MLTAKKEPPYYEIEENIAVSNKVWEGIWTQYISNLPTTVIKRNTLGSEITWTRVSTGQYRGTVTGITFGENTWIDWAFSEYALGEVFMVRVAIESPTTIEVWTGKIGEGPRDGICTNAYSFISIKITNQ